MSAFSVFVLEPARMQTGPIPDVQIRTWQGLLLAQERIYQTSSKGDRAARQGA